MMRNAIRWCVLISAPLLYGLVANWSLSEAENAFDVRMRRDRSQLAESLAQHGASSTQIADVLDYEASVSRNVSGLTHSTAFAGVCTLMFLGVTLGTFIAVSGKTSYSHPTKPG